MSATRTTLRPGAAEDFEAMLEIGVDAGEAFFAIGASYEALRLQLKRRQRLDLVEKLREWRERDTARLRHAQGRSWW